jgi:hypothetical protein
VNLTRWIRELRIDRLYPLATRGRFYKAGLTSGTA